MNTDVRRIANHNIKPLAHPKHPLRVKEIGGGVLVVGVPVGQLLGYAGEKAGPGAAIRQVRCGFLVDWRNFSLVLGLRAVK